MKTDRHGRIIELITERNIETQEELAELLKKDGFKVTQATISRDIRELKLVKVSMKDGCQKYAINNNHLEERYSEKYIRVLKDSYLTMDVAQNIIVIKTVSGMAMAAAAAVDALKFPGCVGTIAGDDTIMVAVKSTDEAHKAMQIIKEMIFN
ncbi:MAG: arginine repressor [Lachnospiraceae bacterium]|nr:arginine repressor [Lachnospiraceae bacterium]